VLQLGSPCPVDFVAGFHLPYYDESVRVNPEGGLGAYPSLAISTDFGTDHLSPPFLGSKENFRYNPNCVGGAWTVVARDSVCGVRA